MSVIYDETTRKERSDQLHVEMITIGPVETGTRRYLAGYGFDVSAYGTLEYNPRRTER